MRRADLPRGRSRWIVRGRANSHACAEALTAKLDRERRLPPGEAILGRSRPSSALDPQRTAQVAESARGISPRAAHRSGLDTLASSGSCHRVKAAAFRCMSGSSRCRLTRPNVGDPLPSLHGHYTRFITTTEQSAPLRRIGTFGLAVGAACAFSLGIAGQVLTFRTRAWLSFAPSTCRMPLGPYQDIPRADPAGRVTPRF